MRRTSPVKALVAFAAVAVAVGSLMPSEGQLWRERLYGRPALLAPAIVRVFEGRSNGKMRFIGTTELIDRQYGLYLTAWHVPEGVQTLFVNVAPGKFSEVSKVWAYSEGDLAIMRIKDPDLVRDIEPLTISSRPPVAGQAVVAAGYHEVRGPGTLRRVLGFRVPFTVIKPATDGCVNPEACEGVQYLRQLQALGFPMLQEWSQSLYSHQIYAEGSDTAILLGVIPGMSGSPVFAEDATVVGVVRGYYGFTGTQAMFAPASAVPSVLEVALRDIRSDQSK